MQILAASPSVRGPADMFTGEVTFDVLYRGEEPSRMRANMVRFAPGARTAWHCHAVGQTLRVTEGIGLCGTRDGKVVVMRPGDMCHTPPGEWHWHGATPDNAMTHLALWEAPAPNDDTPESTWGAHVSDADYRVPVAPR